MKEKIMSLLLILCLCAGSVVFPADGGMTVQAASTEEKTSGDYKYRILEDGTAEITEYIGDDKEVVVPSKLDGKKVKWIEERAFYSNKKITKVEISEGITHLWGRTFLYCSNLTSITLPKSLEYIGSWSFEGTKLKDVWYAGTLREWVYVQRIASIPNHEELKELYDATIHFSDGTTSDDPYILVDWGYQTSLIYNGKPQKPTIIVRDKNDKTIASKNYTVKYSNNKNVGQANVTVTLKGKYKGTIKTTFDIIPKGTSISQITAKKKGFALKWKKQTTQTTGYEIQYADDINFMKVKTVKNIKASTTSKSISNLSANKKYYVKIRTYKTVKGKRHYSGWSKSRSVKTKG